MRSACFTLGDGLYQLPDSERCFMRWIGYMFACTMSVLVAACAPQHRDSAQHQQLYHLVAERPVTCKEGKDCDTKWARAVEWVREHNVAYAAGGRKIAFSFHKLTRNVIHTGEATLPETQFRIVRYPREDGTFGIDYYSGCDEIEDCYLRSGRLLKMSFVSTLIGLPKGVTFKPPNIYTAEPGVLVDGMTH